MRTTGLLVVLGTATVVAVWLVTTGWRGRRGLGSTMRRLHRRDDTRRPPKTTFERIGRSIETGSVGERWGPSLRLIGRSLDTHVGMLAAVAVVGLATPSLVVAVLGLAGLVSSTLALPAIVSVTTAALAPAIVHADAMAKAADVRIDVRYQISAYLDMVTMLLAGNTGHEGALQQAAAAGDGLLFRQLRRRMREVGTTGQSLVDALTLVADDYDLVELRQVAATTALSASQGAPVATTLAAKCSTLRGTIAAEQEAEARVRTDKVTPPLVGMALLFMALIIYPALTLN